jgi:biotin/methionine sulfoxide reductase
MAVSDDDVTLTPTATHWGTYYAEVKGGRLVGLRDYEKDPAPGIIGPGIVDAVDDAVRVRQPMVRKGWLQKKHRSDTTGRGREPFVALPWDEALDMAAEELARVKREHGNEGIFAGSYGWSSAGRFHHAQSQVHRFINCLGGYTRSLDTYSYAAGQVITPYVVGKFKDLLDHHTTWPVIAEHTDLVVMFGGLPVKNAQINSGGLGRHTLFHGLKDCFDAGVKFVNISPIRTDAAPNLEAEWIAPRPGSDAALLLALCWVLHTEGLADRDFLARYATGYERFLPYLLGEADGQAKTPEWAAPISEVDAETIRGLARRMAGGRTMITAAWGMQRGDHGEQVYWLVVTLAAMLGQIGLPGGGFGLGYASENGIGNPVKFFQWPALPQGINNVKAYIPVARISDMLLNPGGGYQYDGKELTYPDIRLIYWAGGNPFHHHQDLNKLVRAFRKPETIMVNEIWWTAMARHADFVFPTTTALERNDIAMTHWEQTVVAMHKAIEPVGESRHDYDVFAGLASRLGIHEAYTDGRDEDGWLRHLWDQARQRAGRAGFELPDFDRFWEQGTLEVLQPDEPTVMLRAFREDPAANPLSTPTGRIEIFSETIAGFGLDDCPGHPVWLEPYEWLGSPLAETYPLHLITNQPRTRLHSQLDSGQVSRSSKIQGREPLTMHPDDAAARGIRNGDVVRVYNDRGACLAGVIVSDAVRKGVAQLSTGAWYDPEEPGVPGSLCKHGNPNVLTRDKGTSKLGQGPSAHSLLVEIEKFEGTPPPVTAFVPPQIEERG